ncbi:hypothetical protein ACEN2J_14485 [Pseudorhodobacter sp. W20_MBD10_FR17]|uniref:hypothetical protein n=1 Tax=Pseudorhodobacter sp. W20_MBD10_FR17 TaxID=3240266 RepID=UPI003F9A0782
MTNDARPSETMISVAALRALCGAKPGEIEALIRSRTLIARASKVSLVAGVRAYLDAIRATAKSASLAAAQDAARSARADAAELALAVDARRLVSVEDAEHAISLLCGAVMSRTFTIPARATRDVRERRIIEDAIRETQGEIARAVPQIDLSEKPTPAKRRARK